MSLIIISVISGGIYNVGCMHNMYWCIEVPISLKSLGMREIIMHETQNKPFEVFAICLYQY
jgi:hypothetical protein